MKQKQIIKVDCGLHGWSISSFIYPQLKGDNTCCWFEYDGIEAKFNRDFCIGTRQEFLDYVAKNNVPLYRPIGDGSLTWVPYGLYVVRLTPDHVSYGEAKGFCSGCVADESDFFPLAYALTGETDFAKLRAFVGSNPYKTACNLAGIKLPRYYKRFDNEENNMFSRGELSLQLV